MTRQFACRAMRKIVTVFYFYSRSKNLMTIFLRFKLRDREIVVKPIPRLPSFVVRHPTTRSFEHLKHIFRSCTTALQFDRPQLAPNFTRPIGGSAARKLYKGVVLYMNELHWTKLRMWLQWASSTGLTAVSKFKPRLPAQWAAGTHRKGFSRMEKVTSRMNWPIRNAYQIRN